MRATQNLHQRYMHVKQFESHILVTRPLDNGVLRNGDVLRNRLAGRFATRKVTTPYRNPDNT